MRKVVDSSHYHVWTDALHLRQLARESHDSWDRSTYVRTAVVMAWTAFETTLGEVLKSQRLGQRFRQNLDLAIAKGGYDPLDWGSGVWQAVSRLNSLRVEFVHRTANGSDLFPEVHVIDDALETIRKAVAAIHGLTGLDAPAWLNDDADRGWRGARGGETASARAHLIVDRVDPQAPETVRLAYEDADGEHVYAYHPSSAEPEVLAKELLDRQRGPVAAIRVYRGADLALEWTFRMRGAPIPKGLKSEHPHA